MQDQKTHFGYETVAVNEKSKRVNAVFSSVARRYDVMNDLMSFGLHRIWKFIAIELAGARAGHRVLDLAAGSGDLSRAFSNRVGPSGQVIATDINADMLAVGRDKLIDGGHINNTRFCLADAQQLPFANDQFDIVSIGFGLRNVTDIDKALRAMYSVLKPGGRAIILEFSKPTQPILGKLYDHYSFSILPMLGRVIAKDEASYRYLAESIRRHPSQDELLARMQAAQFEECSYHNLCQGIVAVHKGFKY